VRAATLDDVPALLLMGRLMHDESPVFRTLGFDEGKLTRLLETMLEGTIAAAAPGGVFVAERAGEVVGMYGGFVVEMWFSQDKQAHDYVCYVKPEHRRRGRAAIGLVRAFEAWAIAQGALFITPGVSTQVDPESTARFYERLGYTRQGSILVKRIH
jgi:GNAT superfamily N-acetyltransferase